jgi:DNA-binding transcriptional ArsR family regulator
MEAARRALPSQARQPDRLPVEGGRSVYLRTCATPEILVGDMTDMLTTSSGAAARDRAAVIARALADAKRLCVVERLAEGECSVSELSRGVGCQVPNMSQHLAVLRAAGIVESRRDGSTVFYRLVDAQILEIYRLMQQVANLAPA